MLTQDRLKHLLRYDPETGDFTRLIYRGGPIRDKAGSIDAKGYVNITVDMRTYKAHRLAWLYMTGKFPDCEVDHRDRNKSNNRWKNLRAATDVENAQNASLRRDNRSGFKGVGYNKRENVWRARINCNGKSILLGRYRTREEAAAAYASAAKIFHGEFAHVATSSN